jgi:hypothetical protein
MVGGSGELNVLGRGELAEHGAWEDARFERDARTDPGVIRSTRRRTDQPSANPVTSQEPHTSPPERQITESSSSNGLQV